MRVWIGNVGLMIVAGSVVVIGLYWLFEALGGQFQ
jgi:hypothetical protein